MPHGMFGSQVHDSDRVFSTPLSTGEGYRAQPAQAAAETDGYRGIMGGVHVEGSKFSF